MINVISLFYFQESSFWGSSILYAHLINSCPCHIVYPLVTFLAGQKYVKSIYEYVQKSANSVATGIEAFQ